ncbi:MAG: hypothetical protein ACREYB_07460 [Casimicrobiaceae bacterium]
MSSVSSRAAQLPQAATASRFDRAWRLYCRRVQRCRTENQTNRLHLIIENYMTPMDVHRFGAALANERDDAPGRAWIGRLASRLPAKTVRAVEFDRIGPRKGFTLYAADTGSHAKKTLIVGFAGHFHRLMVPMPVLLDCLNPAFYDVVILRDFARLFFARGIDGLGGDFVETMSSLRERFDFGSYRNVIALGTSSGGLPALLAAIMLRLDRGVSLGAIDFPVLAARLRNHGIRATAHAELLAARPQPFPELILAYGAHYGIDVASTKALHDRVPSRLHAVEKCDTHNLFAWHMARGKLPAFLQTLLAQDLETGQPAASSPCAAGFDSTT